MPTPSKISPSLLKWIGSPWDKSFSKGTLFFYLIIFIFFVSLPPLVGLYVGQIFKSQLTPLSSLQKQLNQTNQTLFNLQKEFMNLKKEDLRNPFSSGKEKELFLSSLQDLQEKLNHLQKTFENPSFLWGEEGKRSVFFNMMEVESKEVSDLLQETQDVFKKLAHTFFPPPALSPSELDRFLKEKDQKYVQIIEKFDTLSTSLQRMETSVFYSFQETFSSYEKEIFLIFMLLMGLVFLLILYVVRTLKILHTTETQKELSFKQIEESENFLKNILKSSHEAVITVDENRVIHYANKAALRLFHYTEEELIGANLSLLMESSSFENHQQYIHQYLMEEERNHIQTIMESVREVRAKKKDGSLFSIEIAITPSKQENKNFFTAFIQDISKKKQENEKIFQEKIIQEKQISIIQKTLKNILNHSLDGVINFTPEGFIQSINPAISHIFEYKENEIVGSHVRKIIPEFYYNIYADYLKQQATVINDSSFRGKAIEVTGFKKNGQKLKLALFIDSLEMTDTQNFVGFIRDISYLKKWEEKNQKQEDLLSLISYTHNQFLKNKDSSSLFNEILYKIISLTQSQGGFICQLSSEKTPKIFIDCCFKLEWDERKHRFLFTEEGSKEETEYLNWLFSRNLKEKKETIQTQIHEGSFLRSYIGLPLFLKDQFLGVLGLINPSEDYPLESLSSFLEPLLLTLSLGIFGKMNQELRLKAEVEMQNFFNQSGFFKSIFDSIPQPIFIKNMQGEVVEANKSFWQLVEKEEEEGKNTYFKDLLRKTPDGILEQDEESALKPSQVFKKEGSYFSNTGELRAAYIIKKAFQPTQKETFIAVIIDDIHELRDAEEKLLWQKNLFLTILNTSNFSIIMTNKEGIIQIFNPAAEQITGYSSEEVIQKETPILFHDITEVTYYSEMLSQELGREIRPSIRTFVEKAELLGKDEREWTYVSKKGKRTPVLLSVSAVKLDTEEVIGYLGVAADITKLKKAEHELHLHKQNLQMLVEEKTQELILAKEEAEKANQTKSEFFSNMSHELRTPMHAILNYVTISLDALDKEEKEKIIDSLLKIQRSGQRLLSLINALLDLSKMEAKKMEFKLGPHDIQDPLNHSLEELHSLFEEKNLSIIIQEKVHNFVACFDASKMMQVFINVLSNAIKFSPEGRSIYITYEEGLLYENGKKNECIQIIIRDEGAGIPEDELEIIFDKFTQSSSTNHITGSTGLGLAICKEILKGHGGTIKATINPGGGAKFIISVPRRCIVS